MAEIVIRAAVDDDLGVLASLGAAVQQLHVSDRPDVFKTVERDALEAWFRQALTDPACRIVIAEVSGSPAGYAVLTDGSRAEDAFAYARQWREVAQIGVAPAYRRQGIASALVEYVVESASADGIQTVELNTWAFNGAARVSFGHLGFTEKTVRYERQARGPSRASSANDVAPEGAGAAPLSTIR